MRERPLSQYGSEKIGIAVYDAGVLSDADGPVVFTSRDNAALVETGNAIRTGEGLYEYFPTESAKYLGNKNLSWNFAVGAQTRLYRETVRVYPHMTTWQTLSDQEKLVIDDLYFRVAHAFDSSTGGPYLWETFGGQNFNAWETLARLSRTEAVEYISMRFGRYLPPFEPDQIPERLQGLHARVTYWSFLKHLSRSYIEQPEFQNAQVARLDRRQYRAEWAKEAANEKDEIDTLLGDVKQMAMSRSRKLLLSGGIYGRYFPINRARPTYLHAPVW